jgi:tetratricopeptide (TPR) repeat protein
LVPTDDVSRLPEIDRRRNLGLAYVGLSEYAKYAEHADTFRTRGRELLEPLYAAGLRDGLTAQALAFVSWKGQDLAHAAAYAQQAIEANDSSAEVRADALVIRADCLVQGRQIAAAIEVLEQVVRLRRNTEDWRLLGRLYLEQNQPRQALEAYQQALSIRPDRPDVHSGLAEAYRRLGHASLANEHEAKSQWLWQHRRE